MANYLLMNRKGDQLIVDGVQGVVQTLQLTGNVVSRVYSAVARGTALPDANGDDWYVDLLKEKTFREKNHHPCIYLVVGDNYKAEKTSKEVWEFFHRESFTQQENINWLANTVRDGVARENTDGKFYYIDQLFYEVREEA